VGKEASRVLEELETEPGKNSFYLYITVAYECFTKKKKKKKTFFHHPPNNPRECDTTATTHLSSDFSSIGSSQSSQVTLNHAHEGQPPVQPATLHSVMNAPAFGEPVSPSIATTAAVAAPVPPAESNTTRPRPLYGNSTTTTAGSCLRYSVATSATHTLETVTYEQVIPLHVGGSGAMVTKETERSTDKGKATEDDKFLLGRSSAYAPISYAMLKDEDLHTTMWIPVPHPVEGYASGIPTPGWSSGFNQYGGHSTLVEIVFGCKYAARSTACSILTMRNGTS